MNRLGLAGALTGVATVSLGAFGAHALADTLNVKQTGWWDTATFYALVHSVTAFAASLATAGKALRAGGWAFLIGVWVFSGSLYAMALGAPSILGAITPIGGVSLIIGWACCAWHAAKSVGKS
ncbi:MAG: DUF423 domain-containing protein [Hyphomonas sp.]